MLTPRLDRLKSQIVNAKPEVYAERALLVTQAYRENENKRPEIQKARAMEKIFRQATVLIKDDELIDRGYALVTNYHQPGHTSLMENKRIGLLVTGADAYENNAEGLFTAFDRIADFLKAPKGGDLYVGGCSLPAELPESVKGKAVDLARSLVNCAQQ